MNFPYGLLPPAWHWGATIVFAVLLVWTIRCAPWHRLQNARQLHVYLGSCVALMLLWTVKAVGIAGLEYHFLGATLVTLMFGWALAAAALSIVAAGATLAGAADWQAYPLNALVMGMFPVAVSFVLFRFVDRRLPNNFFVYVFGCAFLGAALALLAAVLFAATLLMLGVVYTLEQLARDYFPLLPLLLFPEAFITGAVIAPMVVYRPSWVSTFDDERYIKGK